jgi:ribonuclease E
VPFVRFSRDRRGYEHTYLIHAAPRRGAPTRILYWYRTPPGVKVGREAFDVEARRLLEAQYPSVSFDWAKLLETPMPAPEAENWRERRRERSARQPRQLGEPEDAVTEPIEVTEPAAATRPAPETAVAVLVGEGDAPEADAAAGDNAAGAARKRRRRGGRRRRRQDSPLNAGGPSDPTSDAPDSSALAWTPATETAPPESRSSPPVESTPDPGERTPH